MIILIQTLKYPPEGWEDMAVPARTGEPPVRGEQPKIRTPAEFAERLVKHGLEGMFRVVLDDGTIWAVTVAREYRYGSVIERVV